MIKAKPTGCGGDSKSKNIMSLKINDSDPIDSDAWFNTGDLVLNAKGFTALVATQATLSGVFSVMQGGKFGHGFASGALSKVSGAYAGGLDVLPIGDVDLAQVAIAAIVGGTVSEISGGKFANGAVTAAILNIYNQQGEELSREDSVKVHYKLKNDAANKLRQLNKGIRLGEHEGEFEYLNDIPTKYGQRGVAEATIGRSLENIQRKGLLVYMAGGASEAASKGIEFINNKVYKPIGAFGKAVKWAGELFTQKPPSSPVNLDDYSVGCTRNGCKVEGP